MKISWLEKKVWCEDEVYICPWRSINRLNTSPDFRETQYSNYVQEDVKQTW